MKYHKTMPYKKPKPVPFRLGVVASRSLFIASTTVSVLLYGCGGGGGGGTTTTGGGGGGGGGPVANVISGTVIDGYIEGAKVCLDLNGNGACDAAEPSATTDASGKYSLNVGSASNVGINLIAEVPDTAKDTDDAGLTLGAAGRSAYTMAAPAAPSAVITPLTTLIVGKVSTEGVSSEVAKQRVLAEQGLPTETNPNEDHIANGNNLVRGVVKQMASQLQQAQSSLPAGTSPGARLAEVFKQIQTAQADAGKLLATLPSGTANPLNMPVSLASVATGTLFSYRMTSVKGKPIAATAMVFTPKSAMPAGGWPMVIFGHGTVGVAQQCAPSVTMKASGAWGYADLGAMLVARGYVVVAPDFEGLGPAAMGVEAGHPYLDFGSAGRSMALAAVAAKKLMTTQLSGSWATLGHSQGGHAALAGAQFASLAAKQEPTLNYKGAIAIAPASNLLDSFNTAWAGIQSNSASPTNYATGYAAVGVNNLYAAYLVKGAQLVSTLVSPSTVFGANMLGEYSSNAGTQCLDEFSRSVSQSVTTYAGTAGATPAKYPGIINAAINKPSIAQLLASNEPGQVFLPGKTLIVQGEADVTVLPAMTTQLLKTMQVKGSNVTLSAQSGPSATHSGVLYMPAAQTAIAQHLADLFPALSATLANLCISPRANTPDKQGTSANEKSYLRSFVDETYLWYKDVPGNLVAANYATPQTYFDALKTPAITASGNLVDQFHWSQTTASWDAASSGIAEDYGIRWAAQASSPPRNWLVVETTPGSPAARAGVKRGDKITSVDGVDFVYGSDTITLNEGLFPTILAPHKFGFNNNPEISMTPTKYDVITVQNVKTFPTASGTVGYFIFDTHIAKSEAELVAAINQLKAANVTDLVIDMRYNGGGLLYIASELAYMVAGPAKTRGKTFEQLTYNDKLTSQNSAYPFYSSDVSNANLPYLGLSHVTILATRGTASASESVINSLRGVNVTVDLIGATTRGKPYGFVPQNNCGYTYFAIQFKGVNDKGYGDYADGFTPTCAAADDYTRARGDAAETMLSTALSYRQNGVCPARVGASAQAFMQGGPQSFELVRPATQEIRILTGMPRL